MELRNSRIIITGGSTGYGYGMAQALKSAGAEVWITGRNAEKLEKAACELKVHSVQADACSGADWDMLFKTVGNVDVLINNAGAGCRIAELKDQTDEEIISAVNTNLTSVILGCRRAAAHMSARRKGNIINISSVCALYAWPAWSVYTAAKAGLAKFSKGLYTEMRPYGVRVTCVTPSWGQTEFNKAANIKGASENPDLSSKCTSPTELGNLIRNVLETPDHLAVPEITLLPMIQDISPM